MMWWQIRAGDRWPAITEVERMEAARRECPDCQGQKMVAALVRGRVPGTVRTGCYAMQIPCATCAGTGAITAEQAARIEAGARLRAARVARDESIREQAKREGVSPAVISDREQGRIP